MKLGRRRLFAVAGVAAVAIAGAVAVFLVLRDDGESLPRYPGRIAVRGGCGLRHMFFDGKDPQEMCLPKVWSAASVSWNGERLAWDTGRGISVANADGFNPQPVPVPPGANVDPSLSPDGDEIAFLHSARDDGRYDVWVGSTAIDNAEQLTTTRDVSSVAWSPTGSRIAFVRGWSEVTLEGEIFLMRPDGSDQARLTAGDVPSWSPDGSRLAFVHDGSVWAIGADGSDRQKIVEDAEAPAWSRDGKMIAFTRAEKCGKPVCEERVFLVPATGGPARPVGPAFAGPRSPLWLPDPFE
jgi:Tol biopolymer transport system component